MTHRPGSHGSSFLDGSTTALFPQGWIRSTSAAIALQSARGEPHINQAERWFPVLVSAPERAALIDGLRVQRLRMTTASSIKRLERHGTTLNRRDAQLRERSAMHPEARLMLTNHSRSSRRRAWISCVHSSYQGYARCEPSTSVRVGISPCRCQLSYTSNAAGLCDRRPPLRAVSKGDLGDLHSPLPVHVLDLPDLTPR